MEKWKAIANFPGYEISDQGQIKSLKRKMPKILSQRSDKDGYKVLILMQGNLRRYVQVHRLVLETFVGPATEGMQACHNDGNPANNRLENLRWDTRKNNEADKVRHGTDSRGEKHPGSRLTEDDIREIRQLYATGGRSNSSIARQFSVSDRLIGYIVRGERWSHVA